MNILKNFLLFNKKTDTKKDASNVIVDQYVEIAKLVKEARIQQNLTIKELSNISILIKLEECLILKKNTLVRLATRERKTFKTEKKELLFRKFDLINTWQGTLLYFFILVLTIFILKRYFVLNINVIEIQNYENKIIDK